MSAAAQAVLVEAPPPRIERYVETHSASETHTADEILVAAQSPEEALRNLVHELSQPLSSIDAIAYYLEMTLPAEQFLARQYMQRIQQLVAEAGSALKGAMPPVPKPCGTAAF
jgi:signal transduction histidine kinase